MDKIDSNFACSIRQEGPLEGFRAYLRKLWETLGGEPDLSRSEALARDFRDELAGEFRKAQAEWDTIDRGLVNWATATFACAMATGAFLPVVAAGGFGVPGLGEIIQAEMKRREFRRRVPMSVFIDLESRR